MCTIMTFSRDCWAEHAETLMERIKQDATSNADGWSMLALGVNQTESSIIRSKRMNTLLEVLDEGWWERVWIHARHATGMRRGLAQCHGWSANDWFVFHNGIARHPKASDHDVDSKVLLPLLESYGIDALAAYCLANEAFCNLLVVNPEEGKWLVSRSQAGSLFTDDRGNYSTHPVATLTQPVDCNSALIYESENFKRKETWGYNVVPVVGRATEIVSSSAGLPLVEDDDDGMWPSYFSGEDRLRAKYNIRARKL